MEGAHLRVGWCREACALALAGERCCCGNGGGGGGVIAQAPHPTWHHQLMVAYKNRRGGIAGI